MLGFCQVMKPERLFGFWIGRVPAVIGYCRPWSHCHTRADPSGGGFASVATEATPVETCHRHVSKSRLSNPFHLTQKRTDTRMSIGSFGGRWWIRTTEVIDDRFTVCSLWPLGKPSIFSYQLDWSWWTDLNPRPADYKSAALPTELHQHFIKSSCLSDLFSIPHTGVFVNRFIRNYCILFFRSIESDTCCRTVSSALDKSG